VEVSERKQSEYAWYSGVSFYTSPLDGLAFFVRDCWVLLTEHSISGTLSSGVWGETIVSRGHVECQE